MGESRKRREARRVREKIAAKPPNKIRQIRQLNAKLDSLPVNPLTGEIMWPEQAKDN